MSRTPKAAYFVATAVFWALAYVLDRQGHIYVSFFLVILGAVAALVAAGK